MGKYPSSKIHDLYSNFHWNKCGKHAVMTDVDRIWFEMEAGKPIAAIDLKWLASDDRMTATEYNMAEWFESHGVPWYTIWINKDFTYFEVTRHRTRATKSMSQNEYIVWVDARCPDF